jgi:hypothetical protein
VTPKTQQQSPPTFKPQNNTNIKSNSGQEVKSEIGIFSIRSGGQKNLIGTEIKISIFVDGSEGNFFSF